MQYYISLCNAPILYIKSNLICNMQSGLVTNNAVIERAKNLANRGFFASLPLND